MKLYKHYLKFNSIANFKNIVLILLIMISNMNCSYSQKKPTMKNSTNLHYSNLDSTKLKLSHEEWKEILPSHVYEIAINKGTERAFTGKYWDFYEKGKYACAACGNMLFASDAKFESSCGWPSFFEPFTENSVKYEEDKTYGMNRVEVLCGRCDAHLGHIFDDGPPPTYKRYCINSGVIEHKNNKDEMEK